MKRFPLKAMMLILALFTLPGLEAGETAAGGYPVVFYSGRGGNKDVYILLPGETEPRNLTNHPAQDLCPAPSPDGGRIAFLSDRGGNLDIFCMKVDGSDIRQLTATPENEEHPEFTPDGKKILFVRDFEKRTEIWVMNADGSDPRRLTRNDARDERPFLSPDGSKILFMSDRDGNYEIYVMAADGSGQTRITNTPEWEIFPAWSPDGREIAYSRKFKAAGRMQGMIRVMNSDGSHDRELTRVETRDENAMWSPDGRFLVFQSVRDGNFEVYQMNRDGSSPQRLTHDPAWDGWASYVPSVKKGPPLPPSSRLGQKPPVRTPEVYAPGIAPAGLSDPLRPQAARPVRSSSGVQGQRLALMTYAGDGEQARAVRALARSIRERGGAYANSPIYAVAPDPEVFSGDCLEGLEVKVLPLETDRAFLDYPLAIKALAAAQVEKKVKDETDILVWLDPGVIVLKSLEDLDLKNEFDAAVRPVTLANTIGIPPQSAPNDYWQPIYAETGLDYKKLAVLETIVDPVRIQPYYNCEVFSFNPRLGIAGEWARLLTRFLQDEPYQKTVCTTFLRKLFLHQAVLSAVLTSKVRPDRIKALPLASAYPFSQHQRLPAARRVSRLEDVAVVIFDRTWRQDEGWLERIPAGEPLREWLRQSYQEYLQRSVPSPK